MGIVAYCNGKIICRSAPYVVAFILSCASWVGSAPIVAAGQSCKFVQEAALPAIFKDGQVLVDVWINGTRAKFRIGTRSAFSQISRAMAQRLQLPIGTAEFRVATEQGVTWLDGARVSQFKIGEKVGATNNFQVMDDGGDGTTDEFAGVVGQNYLNGFDIELDPALNRVNLFLPIECPADAAYWANEHFELPLATDLNRRPRVRVSIDGQDLDAYLDTGAAHSSIDFAIAKRKLDLPPDIDPPEPTRKVGGVQPPNPTFTFKQIVFGPITVRNPRLELQRYRPMFLPVGTTIRASASDDAPVIIGMDILGRFHSMLSPRNGMLYFTLPNERLSAPAGTAKPQ